MDTVLDDLKENFSFENEIQTVNNFYKSSNIYEDDLDLCYSRENILKSEIDLSSEENKDLEKVINELNEAIQIDLDQKRNIHNDECDEIISILKKPIKKIRSYKNRGERNLFKCLKAPKKISLVGRVLTDTPSIETQNSSGQTNPETLSTP